MNSDGHQVHGLASVTGGSLPAQIWHDFMLAVTDERQMSDPFTEVPEEVVQAGTRLEELFGGGTTTTTGVPQPQPGGPPATEPTETTRNRPGGPGNSSTTAPSSTSSLDVVLVELDVEHHHHRPDAADDHPPGWRRGRAGQRHRLARAAP